MRMIFFAALSLAFSRNSFLFSQQPAEFTEQEIKIIQSCEENITNKVYSPVEADKCLSYLHAENDKLLDKLYDKKPDGTRRAELILKYENALKELGDFYEDNPREDLIQKKLIKLLEFDYEAEGCSLCDIGMGPQPEKIGEWAGKHAPAHSNKTLSAIKTWKALPNVRTQSLGKYGYTEANWADKTIRQRAATLVADEILQEELTKDNRKELRRAADDILFLLDAGMQERLEEYFKDSKEPA
ncbi:MAG: hypothetical protein HY746_04085, partial [Elusimicrobia bacterium]|nr:hypothetical protein [Elusimicrobiota bacterium]